MSAVHEVIYLHGLESGPTGRKGSWLSQHHGAYAVDLDTRHARASYQRAAAQGVRWGHQWPDIEEDLRVPLERATAAIGPETRVIVGSSFGGALLTRLIDEGIWNGPSLFIASAGLKLIGSTRLPQGAPMILLHGRGDSVIPLEDARTIAANSGPNVILWEIDDDHRMASIMPSGILDLALDYLLRSHATGSSEP